MSTNTKAIPDDMAARVARLINEAEDMRQQAADDLKQIYADLREELRGLGWTGSVVSTEVAALKGAIAEMRLDDEKKAKREEKGERVDDYVSLLTRARARGQRKSDERFDPITGEFIEDGEVSAKLVATVATGLQTETGRMALVKALDIMIEREPDEERRSDLSLNIQTKHEDIRTAPVTAEESLASGPCEAGSERAAREGADSVLPTKPKFVLRPYCLKPGEGCGGSGTTHCHSCLKAREEVAA